jgi:hypothetical protein
MSELAVLKVYGKPVAVGERDLIKKQARTIGLHASVVPAHPEHVRELPGVKVFTPVTKAVLAPETFKKEAEGVGAGMGYVPDGPNKTKAVNRNFARMADGPTSSYRHFRDGEVRTATGYVGSRVNTYVYGSESDVRAYCDKLLAEWPAQGYMTDIKELAPYDKGEFYAFITRFNNSD